MPKIQFTTSMNAGPWAIFVKDAADKMVGQSASGFTVIKAEQTAPDEILLTLEGELTQEQAAVVSGFSSPIQRASIAMQLPDEDMIESKALQRVEEHRIRFIQ